MSESYTKNSENSFRLRKPFAFWSKAFIASDNLVGFTLRFWSYNNTWMLLTKLRISVWSKRQESSELKTWKRMCAFSMREACLRRVIPQMNL